VDPRSFQMADLTEQALSWSCEGMTIPDRPRYKGHRSRPLTCIFGAPGRTRTCTLRIRSRPTTVHGVAHSVVLVVKSVGSSSRYGPVTRCSAWRNDQGNDHADVVAADSPSPQAPPLAPGPFSG